ncbi:hypothetical protein GB937_009781 [Aspergillus fischeri]|nr:hypothetical protein GB937_009781 [Aspergillus fischeri]
MAVITVVDSGCLDDGEKVRTESMEGQYHMHNLQYKEMSVVLPSSSARTESRRKGSLGTMVV